MKLVNLSELKLIFSSCHSFILSMLRSEFPASPASPASTQGSSAPNTPPSHPRTPRASPDAADASCPPGAPTKYRRTNLFASPSSQLVSPSPASAPCSSSPDVYLPHLVDVTPILAHLSDDVKASVETNVQKLALMQQSISLSIQTLNTISSAGKLTVEKLKVASDLLIELDAYSCTLMRIWANCEWMFTREYASLSSINEAADVEPVEKGSLFHFFPVSLSCPVKETPKQLMGRKIDNMRRETFELSRAVDRVKRVTLEAANEWMSSSSSSSSLHTYANQWKRYTLLWQQLVQKVHEQIQHVRVFARMI